MRRNASISGANGARIQSFREPFRGPIWRLGAAHEGLNREHFEGFDVALGPRWARRAGSTPRAEELRFGGCGKYSSTGNEEKCERLTKLGTIHSEFRSEVAFWRGSENSKGLASLRDL